MIQWFSRKLIFPRKAFLEWDWWIFQKRQTKQLPTFLHPRYDKYRHLINLSTFFVDSTDSKASTASTYITYSTYSTDSTYSKISTDSTESTDSTGSTDSTDSIDSTVV